MLLSIRVVRKILATTAAIENGRSSTVVLVFAWRLSRSAWHSGRSRGPLPVQLVLGSTRTSTIGPNTGQTYVVGTLTVRRFE